ncbi:hypothetical protein O3G_MSEX004534 [Manduca sexta]|nr:hypothetical protein O3G_MSEX004534 [Manduca sexta]
MDLSPHRSIHSAQDNYDKEQQQGLYRKMETDVTGDCETLYTVSPVAAEWRRELPKFASEEDPIEITKSKNYGHCHHRVAYHFGVPDGAEWTGTAHRPEEEQFIRRATVSRILAGKQQRPIYKAETTSTVNVHPHLYGKQKAEVHSHVHLQLASVEQDHEPEWPQPEGNHVAKNLLYSMSPKQIASHDSSSSSSSSESHEHIRAEVQGKQRKPRSAKPQKVIAISKVIVKRNDDDTSASSSSSSDSSSAYVNDEVPNINEPAYAALYMSPQQHNDKKQNPMNAQKLLQDIAQQLQNPNNMPKADFLSKFNILVRVIASMSTAQLAQTSRSIEAAKASNNNIKSDMWMIYRDAVAQAGTQPAFQQIKTWIESKKIQGEEAAQVVASLPTTLRYPTREVMTQFFKLARDPEVKDQSFLNTTALIASTRFINMGQVNNESAHSFYPTHMYGRLARKHDSFVLEQILPPLAADLQQAIERQESHKAQVYIKAIGNLGHPEILKTFAPYLEGQIKVSNYLRVQMVQNLQVLAHQKNKQARAVLYSILRNTAENYEVRVAAIQNIFMAHPTGAMMQAMAEMTYEDPSVHVRAALKSGIESAAQLKNPRYWNLARAAESAKWMLTKEKFGYQHSMKKFFDGFDQESEQGIFAVLSHTGSEDSLAPKHLRYSVRSKQSGWDKESTIQASFSSVKHFLDKLKDSVYATPAKSEGHKYSAEKIAKMLNIKREHNEPLEAALYIDLINQQRYFTFDENDQNQLVNDIRDYLNQVEKGVDKHYTKVLNQAQVSVMFPVASGMPFIYKYKVPTVVHIESKAKGEIKTDPKNSQKLHVKMDKEIQFTYARNIDGNVGYMDTLVNQYASVGVVNKLQVHIPVKMNIEANEKQLMVKVQPLRPEQDNTILHYSVWPYSANQKKDTLVPISLDPTSKVVERPKRVMSIDSKFGQSIGNIFHLQGYSQSQDFKNIAGIFKSQDALSSIASIFSQNDVALTHFNLRYLGKQSPNKAVTLTAVYDEYHNQKNAGEMGPVTEEKDLSPNSEARRQSMAKRSSAGINTAKARVVDLSASFEGPQKAEYVLTAALSDSPVDPKIQAVFAVIRNSAHSGQSQVNGVAHMKKPEIEPFNSLQILDKDFQVTFQADVKYGPNGNIHLQGQAQRTKKYAEDLKKHPQAKKCAEEIANNNKYQHSCHKLTLAAHAPDHFQMSINYKDVAPAYTNWTYHAANLAQHYGFWYTETNPLKRNPEGKIDIEVNNDYIDHTLSASMTTKYGHVRVSDVPIPKGSARILAIYHPFKPQERAANAYTRHQYQPYCSVDGTKVQTFSRRSYEYQLTSSWHVVLQDQRSQHGFGDDLVILARKPKPDQQEVYISYKDESGKDLEIEIKPDPEGKNNHKVDVKTNAKKVSEGELTTYWDDAREQPLLEYHSKHQVLELNIANDKVRVMYDGQRLVVLASENRKSARGICGPMTGEPRDDYQTPDGLVDQPELYGASFTLSDENADPKTQELKNKAKTQAYQPQTKYTAILHSDDEWNQKDESSMENEYDSDAVYKSRSYNKKKGPCQVEHQVQYYENHGEICISTGKLPACQSHCVGGAYKIQPVQVSCRPKFDQQYRALRDQIKQGQNPQVSGMSKSKQFKVPISCKA